MEACDHERPGGYVSYCLNRLIQKGQLVLDVMRLSLKLCYFSVHCLPVEHDAHNHCPSQSSPSVEHRSHLWFCLYAGAAGDLPGRQATFHRGIAPLTLPSSQPDNMQFSLQMQ